MSARSWCAAFAAVAMIHAASATAVELQPEEASLDTAPLGALLLDLAGSALQRQSAVALALEAGETGARARLDLPLRYGYFNDKRRLDIRLSGPVKLGSDDLEEGETSLFGDAVALETAFTYIRWNPGSLTSEQMRTELCGRFQQRFPASAGGGGAGAVPCTARYFERLAQRIPAPDAATATAFREQIVSAWRAAYLAWNQAAETCKVEAVVVPVDERYASYLPPTPSVPENCQRTKTDHLLIFRLGLAGGYRSIDRLDAQQTAVSKQTEYPYAAELSIGWYLSDEFSLTLGADYQSFFTGGEQKTLCDGGANNAPLICQAALAGGVREESPGVALDIGYKPAGLPLAYRLIARYRSEDDLATLKLPIFLATGFNPKVDQLGGGIELSWDNRSDEARISLFVGRSFNAAK